MKQNIFIYFLLFFSLIGSATKAQIGIGTEEKNSTFKAPLNVQDNPVAAMLDSLSTLQFFDRTNKLYDINYPNINNFAKDFVPFYSDEVYISRFAQLDKTSPVPLVYNRQVKDMIELYAVRKRGLTERMLGLAQLYFPMIEEMLDRYGIPLEMKYLAVIESALNPIARSPVGAGGLWQFMYGTGKQYNLDVNSYVDERSDPYKSTIAACKYLKDLYKVHKDWLLVMAAYNSGSGNVTKAIRRSGGKTNFWDISPFLPKETRSYVPAFIAVTYLMNHASDHNLFPVMPLYKYHEIDTVAVKDFLTFDVLSERLNVPKEEISFLNPAFRKGVIPSTSTKSYFIRLPKRALPDFVNNEASLYAYNQQKLQIKKDEVLNDVSHSQESFFHYVKRGETLASISNHYDVASSDIRQWNHLTRNSVRKGQRLIINRTQGGPEDNYASIKDAPKAAESQSLTQAMHASAAPLAKDETAEATTLKHHTVKRNENLSEIAEMYGVSNDQILKWNNLKSSNLKSGRRLKIYVTNGEEPLLADQKSTKAEKLLASKTVSEKSYAKQDKEPKAAEESEFHKVKSGESLDKLSKTYNVSIAHLKEWNNLNKKGTIMPGQHLIVSKAESVEKDAVLASTDHATKKKTATEKAPTKTYAVKRGDSFSSISKRFSMTIAELKSLNSRIGEELKFGQKIFVSGIPPMVDQENASRKEYASGNSKQHEKTITYKVQPGDTLWRIVLKHKGTSIDELKELNNLKTEEVVPGQLIKIVVAS
jgi:membrane-bound lytic murein transglycosylase D